MFQKPSSDNAVPLSEQPSYLHSEDTIETIVGPSMNVEGDFVSEGNIIVKGFISGSIKTNRTLSVEQGARVVADVNAAEATISGQLRGNIHVAGKLEITSSAQILGDIECETLIVQAGALMQGKVSMAGIQLESGKQERRRTSIRSTKSRTEDGEEEELVA